LTSKFLVVQEDKSPGSINHEDDRYVSGIHVVFEEKYFFSSNSSLFFFYIFSDSTHIMWVTVGGWMNEVVAPPK
jgi:hypothetical protein